MTKRVFKTRYFARWMRKTELTNSALCEAVAEMVQGLVDADLGGGVVKKACGATWPRLERRWQNFGGH
jgi:hypothetical protein